MPELGPLEILVIAVIALIVFGPEKLPEMARNVGRFASDLRRMASDVRSDFHDALDEDEEVEEDRTAIVEPEPRRSDESAAEVSQKRESEQI